MRNTRFGLHIGVLALLALASPARACELIQDDNNRLAKKHNALAGALQQLEANLVLLETTCQNEQKLISAKGAQAATAESCVALKENAAMNRDLTSSSRKCSTQIALVEKQVHAFTEQHMAPFEEGMRGVMEVDKMARQALPHCGAQFRKATQIHEAAEATLVRSRAALAKSRDDISRFTKLGDTTSLFATKTQAAVDRCGLAEPANSLLSSVKGGRQDIAAGGASAGERVSGRHENGKSDITGDLRRAHLASGNTSAVAREKLGDYPEAKSYLPAGALGQGGQEGSGSEALGTYTKHPVPGGMNGQGLRVPLSLAETRDEKGIGEMIRIVAEAETAKSAADGAVKESVPAFAPVQTEASQSAPAAQGLSSSTGPAPGRGPASEPVKLVTLSDSSEVGQDTLFKRVNFQHRKWEFLGPVQTSVAGSP